MEPATPLPPGLAEVRIYELEIGTDGVDTFRFLKNGQNPPVLRKVPERDGR